MFGIEALDVVIGMIFIYLLFSLFVSIINEALSGLLNTRGKRLYNSIEDLIGKDAVEMLYEDPRVKVLIAKGNWLSRTGKEIKKLNGMRLPESIPNKVFGEVLAKIPNDKINEALDNLDDSIKSDKKELANIFNNAMNSVSDAYKRKLRWVLIGLGLLVSISFNVDSLRIFNTLKDDPEVRASVVAQATDLLELEISMTDSSTEDSVNIAALRAEINSLRSTQIDQLDASLGLGWKTSKDETIFEKIWKTFASPSENWRQILGWFISAIAISMGAPFWYDTLRRVINIKHEIKKTNNEQKENL